MKKIILLIGIVMLLILHGCIEQSNIPMGEKEKFCHDKNMKYVYDSADGTTFYCSISAEYYNMLKLGNSKEYITG